MSLTATIGYDDTGVLNGYHATGNFHFEILSGPNGVGTGSGGYDYPLSYTVVWNIGDGEAPVEGGGSMAGLSGTSGLSGPGHVSSTATLLNGEVGEGTTIRMSWSLGSGLTSDVLDLTGIEGNQFVLQMSYDPETLPASEESLAAAGLLMLVVEDLEPSAHWVNAIDLNFGANVGAANVQGPWSGQTDLGTWGVETAANTVWAVLDHNSNFASSVISLSPIPESTSWLCGLPLMALFAVLRRNLRANRNASPLNRPVHDFVSQG